MSRGIEGVWFMRISYLTLALALAAPATLLAQSAPELTEQSVANVNAAPAVQIAQRGDRGFGGNRENGGASDGNRRGDLDNGNRENGFRRRGGGSVDRSATLEQSQAQPDIRPQQRFERQAPPAAPQIDRNPFGRGGRDGSTLNTSPPQIPQAQAQNGGGFRGDRGDRFGNSGGNRDDAFGRRFGNRGGNGPQIDTRPQHRPEGHVFDQNRDGRFGERGRPHVNHDNRGGHRGGVVTHDSRHDGGRFDGNRDGRFDGHRNNGTNHRFERHGGGWVDRGNRFGNDHNQHRSWNREWRGDRRYNWQGYRNQYRDNYRQPRYYNPYGYGYGYQRHGIGIYLNSLFFSSRYWINDPYQYRLPAAPYGYRWIRYYDDVLLVDQRSGYVVDVIHNFFW